MPSRVSKAGPECVCVCGGAVRSAEGMRARQGASSCFENRRAELDSWFPPMEAALHAALLQAHAPGMGQGSPPPAPFHFADSSSDFPSQPPASSPHLPAQQRLISLSLPQFII